MSRRSSQPIIEVQNISKLYHLGELGPQSVRETAEKVFAKLRGRAPKAKPRPEQRANDEQAGPAGNSFWALRDVSFNVQPGEVVGIIGHNGAGKSTLLKVLSRITEPTSGRVVLRGRVASLLEVGTGFHPELTGRENVFLNGTILGMKRSEIARKYDEILDFAGIGPFIDTPVKRYSSGMYVRLAFAVAAHLEPEILIVDEVLAVGDMDFQKKCMSKMNAVAREGRTVLLISHNIGLLETLCTHAVLLRAGQVRDQGMIGDVVSSYLHSLEQQTSTNIGHLPRARGTHVARFTHVQLLDEEGRATTDFRMGRKLTVELTLQVTQRVAQPWIAITLRTALNQQLFLCANLDAGYDLGALEGDCTVRCEFENLNLLPGRYVLDLTLADVRSVVHDEVSSATSFDILVDDVLKSGVLLHEHGMVFYRSHWSVQAVTTPALMEVAERSEVREPAEV